MTVNHKHETDKNLLATLYQQHLSPDQYSEQLLSEQQESNIPLIPFLILNKNFDACELATIISKHYTLPTTDLSTYNPLQLPFDTLPPRLTHNHRIIPFATDNKTISVACYCPQQVDIARRHQDFCPKTIMIYIDSYLTICHILNKRHTNELFYNIKQTPLQTTDTNPIQLIDTILTDSIINNASDIHLQPNKKYLSIKVRIDGLLSLRLQLPATWSPNIMSRLKILANLDISENRLPQDGRFTFHSPYHHTRDCRLNFCPSIYGEKCVIRLLNPNQNTLAIPQLQLNKQQYQIIQQAITQPQGLILITGPTGSGKTQTLYTLINTLNQTCKNIITIENPVEIRIAQLHQINISHALSFGFVEALRACLRQDPDIIMIGEIRDKESASIAIHAAQTGHLVFATLHTNSSQDTLTRLLNMGIPPYQVANALSLVIAQRLVRALCQYCKIPDHDPPKLNNTHPQPNYYQAQGCHSCTSGYNNRFPIFELLPITLAIKKILAQPNATEHLCNYLSQHTMTTLWDNALYKVTQGKTSFAEIQRTIPPPDIDIPDVYHH